MQIFRPDDQPDRPHGIMMLRERAAAGRDEDCRPPLRMRLWPLVSMTLILISGLIGTPTPALHGEGLVTLLGGGTIAALIVIEVWFDPQDDRAVFAYVLLLGLASIALMTVQPAGTAVLGTYAAVASAVIRLPKRLAIAAIVPIIAIVDILILIGGEDRLLVLAWTNIAYVFMFVIGHLLRLSEERQIQARELLEEEERTRLARNEAAALDERGRIARELHDVLAHSLSALSVELEGARLLALDRDVDSEVIAAIGRAHRHAASGLDEARAAIKALRGDSVPRPGQARGPDRGNPRARDRVHAGDRRRAAPAALAKRRWRSSAPPRRRSPTCASTPRRPSGSTIRLDYDPDGVQLIVTDSAGDGAEPRVPQPAALAGGGLRLRGERDARAGRADRRPPARRADRGRLPGRALGAGVSDGDAAGGETLRVIVADDQRVVREGLTLMLGLIDGIEPVGAAADGEEALAMVAAERPDVVLMDLRMPRLDGIEATRRLAETHPGGRRRRAHHLRRRRDRRRRPAGGRARLPDQGRRRRADPQRGRAGGGGRGGDRPGRAAPADHRGAARRGAGRARTATSSPTG